MGDGGRRAISGKLAKLERGIQRKAYHTLPAKAHLISDPNVPPRSKPVTPHRPTAWTEIKLREEKKRQIRRMTAAVGLPTLHLIRVAIGRLGLENIEPGQWGDLTQDETNLLQK